MAGYEPWETDKPDVRNKPERTPLGFTIEQIRNAIRRAKALEAKLEPIKDVPEPNSYYYDAYLLAETLKVILDEMEHVNKGLILGLSELKRVKAKIESIEGPPN